MGLYHIEHHVACVTAWIYVYTSCHYPSPFSATRLWSIGSGQIPHRNADARLRRHGSLAAGRREPLACPFKIFASFSVRYVSTVN